MKKNRLEERRPCSCNRSLLIGLTVGIAVPCVITYLVDRIRREGRGECPVGDPFLIYDDGSLEPELFEEHLYRRKI